MTRAIVFLLLAAVSLTACRTTTETEVVSIREFTADKELREIPLPPGTSIGASVGDDAQIEMYVTVPEGETDAGTYVTRSPYLFEGLHAIRDGFGRLGNEALIRVDDTGEIVSVTHTVTMP